MKKTIQNFVRYRFLLNELVLKGIKLRYRRSYLGVFWTLLEPLFTMIVLTLVFGPLLGYSNDKTFPVYILSGRLVYNFFAQATKTATRAIRTNSAMIKKVYVPKYLYPMSCVIYNFIMFLISLIVLAAVSLVLKIAPGPTMLLVIIPLINMFLLTYGIGMFLAAVGVFFRDMEYLWNVALMLIMYTSAIFYKIDRFGSRRIVLLLKANPLYCIIDNFRSCILGYKFNWSMALYSIAFSVVAIVIGTIVFNKNQEKFILHI